MSHDEMLVILGLLILGLALAVAWDRNRPRR